MWVNTSSVKGTAKAGREVTQGWGGGTYGQKHRTWRTWSGTSTVGRTIYASLGLKNTGLVFPYPLLHFVLEYVCYFIGDTCNKLYIFFYSLSKIIFEDKFLFLASLPYLIFPVRSLSLNKLMVHFTIWLYIKGQEFSFTISQVQYIVVCPQLTLLSTEDFLSALSRLCPDRRFSYWPSPCYGGICSTSLYTTFWFPLGVKIQSLAGLSVHLVNKTLYNP